ncbi:Mitochondrial import inner membrane translocase subunit tim8 [Sporothrix epigloea]|uniref:Mitochondrial import inner membrane translocase subunit n=1 Tax=Sporothrix epigloea TaxID=1892477 RepID=A0ABP0DUU3_9PEZI
MSSSVSLDPSVINSLSDKEKEELRQFVNTQSQRTRVQAQTHNLTDICWKKCITSPVKSNALEKTEEACMNNCVERFLDLNILTAKLLSNMQR